MSTSYARFVALGDSQTEGLNDLAADGGYVGWADRLAHLVHATTSPGLHYANLAVGGSRAADVHDRQLPVALELEPDLATVAVGMNDVLRHDFDLHGTLDRIERTFAALRATGCRVATMTFPDLGQMLPVLRWLRPREVALNAGIRAAADRHGVATLDLFPLRMCAERRMWSPDRIHASPLGHSRIAAGMAELLGLPRPDRSWNHASDGLVVPRRWAQALSVGREVHWVTTFLVPFLARQLRGGPSREAKRPLLLPLAPGAPALP